MKKREGHYSRNVSESIRREDGGAVEEARLSSELESVGLEYDSGLSIEDNQARLRTMQYLIRRGLASISPEGLVFDIDKLKDLDLQRKTGKNKLGRTDLIVALRGLRGYSKQGIERAEETGEEVEARDILALPKSSKEITTTFSEAARSSLLNVWDIGKSMNWVEPIPLASGEETNRAELLVVKTMMVDLKARRNQEGDLEVWDSEAEIYRTFSASLFYRLSGLKPTTYADPENRLGRVSFVDTTAMFAQRHLPNLLQQNFLRASDFRRVAGSLSAEVFNVHEKRFGPGNPMVQFTNRSGYSARYYLGQGVFGSDIDISSGRCSARLLDQDTVGVFEDIDGKKALKYTFRLFDDTALGIKQAQARERLSASGREADSASVSAVTVISAAELKPHVRRYEIADYLPPRDHERPEEYGSRIARLADADYVSNEAQKFFAKAEIGLHFLPWPEQLVLAGTLRSERNRNRLTDFAKSYGIDGVRSFLSLEYGREMGEVIYFLGEVIDERVAANIFSKYGEIISASYNAAEHLENITGGETDRRAVAGISETLRQRAKDLLVQFAKQSRAARVDTEKLLQALQNIKTEVVLFAASFREVVQSTDVSSEEIIRSRIEVGQSAELSFADREEMVRIFIDSRQDEYSVAEMEVDLRHFKESLGNPDTKIYIMRYEDDIVSFLYSRPLPNGNMYVGGFNVRKEAKGSLIGSAVLKMALDQEALYHDIEADCSPTVPILSKYVSDYGFEVVGEERNYEGTGVQSYKLLRRSGPPGSSVR